MKPLGLGDAKELAPLGSTDHDLFGVEGAVKIQPFSIPIKRSIGELSAAALESLGSRSDAGSASTGHDGQTVLDADSDTRLTLTSCRSKLKKQIAQLKGSLLTKKTSTYSLLSAVVKSLGKNNDDVQGAKASKTLASLKAAVAAVVKYEDECPNWTAEN